MSSLTLVLSGNSSSLRADYFPPIELDPNSNYECCLTDFHTYNTIPNINEANNKLHVNLLSRIVLDPVGFKSDAALRDHLDTLRRSDKIWTEQGKRQLGFLYHLSDYHKKIGGDLSIEYYTQTVHELPVGSYELDEIIDFLQNKLDAVHISYDKNTARTSIKIEDNKVKVDFTQPNSIRNILGFGSVVIGSGQTHIGEYPINITTINAVRIECNIATGSFINSKSSHTLHEFYPEVASGYKINETPRNLIYLPIVDRTIRTLHCDIVDQNNNLIDFQGETITCRIHIKKV